MLRNAKWSVRLLGLSSPFTCFALQRHSNLLRLIKFDHKFGNSISLTFYRQKHRRHVKAALLPHTMATTQTGAGKATARKRTTCSSWTSSHSCCVFFALWSLCIFNVKVCCHWYPNQRYPAWNLVVLTSRPRRLMLLTLHNIRPYLNLLI